VTERRFFLCLELRNNALREDFSEFDTPLVEAVDIPNRTLCKHRMFIKRSDLSP
jgi:hypothetical protein